MSARRITLLLLLVAVIVGSSLLYEHQTAVAARPVIEKQAPTQADRTFDPEAPPADMPPFSPGELAVCDSDFQSSAGVAGEFARTDATHGIVTITRVTVRLRLSTTIWTPVNADGRVIEHERGHRQISEHFYAGADELASQIAASYLGQHLSVSGANLEMEYTKALQDAGTEITKEFSEKLGVGAAQERYDELTDHSRNDVAAADAIAEVLKNSTSSAAGNLNGSSKQ